MICFHFSNSEPVSATNHEKHYVPPLDVFSDRMSLLTIHSLLNRFNSKDKCGIQLKLIKSSKSSQHLRPRAFHSCPPCLVISFPRISRHQSEHKSGSFNSKYRPTSQSKARKSPAHVLTPSITSEPLPKRPENPSGATAEEVGLVHRGPRRDQLLDHGGMAVCSRTMQRRLASGAEGCEAEGAAAAAPRRNKAYQMGCFSDPGCWAKKSG